MRGDRRDVSLEAFRSLSFLLELQFLLTPISAF